MPGARTGAEGEEFLAELLDGLRDPRELGGTELRAVSERLAEVATQLDANDSRGAAQAGVAFEELGDLWAQPNVANAQEAASSYARALQFDAAADVDERNRRLSKLEGQLSELSDDVATPVLEDLARYYAERNYDWGESLRVWAKVLERKPSEVEALHDSLDAMLPPEFANESATQLLERHANAASGSGRQKILYTIAQVRFAQRDWEAAAGALVELAKLSEKEWTATSFNRRHEVFDMLAQARLEQGDLRGAADALVELATETENPEIWQRAAEVFAQLEDWQSAANAQAQRAESLGLRRGPSVMEEYGGSGSYAGGYVSAGGGGAFRQGFTLGSAITSLGEKRETDRQLTVTGHSADSAEAVARFQAETRYRIRFSVGPEMAFNLAAGDLTVSDVPEGGLRTTWLVSSHHVEFHRASRGRCGFENDFFTAKFELVLPQAGASEWVELTVRTPEASLDWKLSVVILVGVDLYRTLDVDLRRGARVERERVAADPTHLNLPPPHEWTTPPQEITIIVQNDGRAQVLSRGGSVDYSDRYDWEAGAKTLGGPIESVRARLEEFRDVHTEYLDALDPEVMLRELGQEGWKPYNPEYVLSNPRDTKEAESALSSPKLHALAAAGFRLFDVAFPRGTPLRSVMEGLPHGTRINITWTKGNGDWVSHVPWALMFLDAPDPQKQGRVACTAFFGLRFRIHARPFFPPHTRIARSYALGGLHEAFGLHLLFWGTQTAEDASIKAEADWQRQAFGAWPNQKFFPSAPGTERAEIIRVLNEPQPAPAALLHLYCQFESDDGNEPRLFFASGPDGVLESTKIAKTLEDSPFIFANACMTAAASAFGVSELEQGFVRRGARAFMGTEARVPIGLASRFAWLFFHFFCRQVAPEPLGAGEALTQARWFLFSRFSNLGGLFYSLSGGYDLVLASDAELVEMRTKKEA